MELNENQKNELKKASELISKARSILSDFKIEQPEEETEEDPDEEEDALEDKLAEMADQLETVESDLDDLVA